MKKHIRILLLLSLLAAAAPGSASAEEAPSQIPTAPMITWEQQRENIAAWNAGNTAPLRGEYSQSTAPSAPGSTATNPGCGAENGSPAPESTVPPDASEEADGGHYIPGSLTSQEQKMVEAVNQERIANGKSPLPVDMELTQLARLKSADMIEDGYFAHESPTLGKAAQMLKDSGYTFTSVSENIARSGSVEKAHAALMSSSGHRQNILGGQWTRMGIGIVNDASGFPYVTQLFVR